MEESTELKTRAAKMKVLSHGTIIVFLTVGSQVKPNR